MEKTFEEITFQGDDISVQSRGVEFYLHSDTDDEECMSDISLTALVNIANLKGSYDYVGAVSLSPVDKEHFKIHLHMDKLDPVQKCSVCTVHVFTVDSWALGETFNISSYEVLPYEEWENIYE